MAGRESIFGAHDDETVADARARLAEIDWAGLLHRYDPGKVEAFVSDEVERKSGVALYGKQGEVAEAARLIAVIRTLARCGVTFGFASDDPRQRAEGIVRFVAELGKRKLETSEIDAIVSELFQESETGLSEELLPVYASARLIIIALSQITHDGKSVSSIPSSNANTGA